MPRCQRRLVHDGTSHADPSTARDDELDNVAGKAVESVQLSRRSMRHHPGAVGGQRCSSKPLAPCDGRAMNAVHPRRKGSKRGSFEVDSNLAGRKARCDSL